jgi:hypothetical protein
VDVVDLSLSGGGVECNNAHPPRREGSPNPSPLTLHVSGGGYED